jgi:hypothetical protein
MHLPYLHMSAICKLGKDTRKADFLGKKWIVKGLKLKQIV